jgi:hypothetical protein
MNYLENGERKASTEESDYPIQGTLFCGQKDGSSLQNAINLSFSDKATYASLKVLGAEFDSLGNSPLKLAVALGQHFSVQQLLKSGCAFPSYKPVVQGK